VKLLQHDVMEKLYTRNGNIANVEWKHHETEAEGSNPKGLGPLVLDVLFEKKSFSLSYVTFHKSPHHERCI
jgi:hypothetical protein